VLDELEEDSIVCSSARTTLYCSEQWNQNADTAVYW
jgi:hypothetical protein